jgi:hypothetical protein
VIEQMRAAGETTLLFNETSGNPLINVDGSDYTSDGQTAVGFNPATDITIGRSLVSESDNTQARQIFDWMATHAGSERHFWFNSLTYGDGGWQDAPYNQEWLAATLDYVYSTYGPGGSDELWMAPSDEIYSYLLIRHHTTISDGELSKRIIFNRWFYLPYLP